MLPLMEFRPAWTQRISRFARISMLVLGVLGVPDAGLAAIQPPHCSQHPQSSMHQVASAGDRHNVTEPGSSTSWENGTQHDCPHCPATECARVAPCTASSSAGVSEASPLVNALVSTRVRGRRVRVRPYSASYQPPTPPPQLIS